MVKLTDGEIAVKLADLNRQISALLPDILDLASSVLGRKLTVHQFHGIIGGKNDEFAKIASSQFASPEDFQTKWAEKMLEFYEPYKKYWHKEEDLPSVIRLYRNETIRKYILLFQERNYYRLYNERIRPKPGKALQVLWFGDKIVFGLYVALLHESDGSIRFKEREVRKVSYEYWTIGNILGVGGFINGETGNLYPIRTIDDLLTFYEHIIYSSSSSQYEKQIYLKYIEYLKDSSDVMSEPFLIPELRYAGKEKAHMYRLDLTICNPYTFECIGFELSPSSTHMAVAGAKGKKQVEINSELADKWEKECDKRNEYFRTYGITTVTFTDSALQDIDACFEQIKIYLQKRVYTPRPLQETIGRINDLMTV